MSKCLAKAVIQPKPLSVATERGVPAKSDFRKTSFIHSKLIQYPKRPLPEPSIAIAIH
jgi:hypothetical protein